jgi:hypothetical protein
MQSILERDREMNRMLRCEMAVKTVLVCELT